MAKKAQLKSKLRGKWHVITLQEAIDYVDHELLTNRFHVTNYGTFYSDVEVKSIYLHGELPDKVMEGGQGWVLQGVLSRASFRRSRLSGQKTFTFLSLHINNIYAKKRGIGKKLILTSRDAWRTCGPGAGDFNGATWRCTNRNNISTIEEAFADCALPTPPGSTPLWRPGWIPVCWADVCGFLEPPESDRYWKVRLHVAFSIPHEAPGLRPTDQSCHHETWLHVEFLDW